MKNVHAILYIIGDGPEKNKLENENQTRERLLQDKNTECENAKQTLSEDNRNTQIKLNDLQGNYDKINGEKIQLQIEYDQVLNNINGLKEDLKGCRENLGKGCEDVEKKLKPEITRLEVNLYKINDELVVCKSNLEIIKTEKTTITEKNNNLNAELSSKTSNLESCQKDLSKIENEKDEFKTKFDQLTTQHDTLTTKDKEQEGENLDLKKQNLDLGHTNSQLTIDSNSCSEDLKSYKKLLDEKNSKITEFDLKILGFTAKESTLKASLLAAQKSKMNGYKESCDLMHQRYKKYYDGASNKSFFDRIIDKFTEWFTSRYSDTKPIWNESSLKGLLCTWQDEGVVRNEAVIKVKYTVDSTKDYTLHDMCTNKKLIESFSKEIINPCNDEGGIWSYDL